jgi:small-conductance mechanosensitive channel
MLESGWSRGTFFNLCFSFLCVLGTPLAIALFAQSGFTLWMGILGILVYILEFFAFQFLLKQVRFRYELKVRGTHSGPDYPFPKTPGWLISYGVLMRMIFRIVLMMFSLSGFGFDPSAEDSDTIFIVVLVTSVLAELVVACLVWFESGLFYQDSEEPGEKKQQHEAREKWFATHKKILQDGNDFREWASVLILALFGWLFYMGIWGSYEADMKAFALAQYQSGTDFGWTALGITICGVLLGLFFLVPLRLAYWIEEAINKADKKSRRKLNFSLFIAMLSMTEYPLISAWRIYFPEGLF